MVKQIMVAGRWVQATPANTRRKAADLKVAAEEDRNRMKRGAGRPVEKPAGKPKVDMKAQALAKAYSKPKPQPPAPRTSRGGAS